jgi:hypothetical protein
MLIMRPVTRGTGDERYSLYVPLFVADIHTLNGFTDEHGEPVPFALLGRTATLRIRGNACLFRAGDWSSLESATQALEKLHALLFHLISTEQAAIWGIRNRQEIDWQEHPIRDKFPEEQYAPWPPRVPQTDWGHLAEPDLYSSRAQTDRRISARIWSLNENSGSKDPAGGGTQK